MTSSPLLLALIHFSYPPILQDHLFIPRNPLHTPPPPLPPHSHPSCTPLHLCCCYILSTCCRLEEIRRLHELALMRKEDAYASKINKFWNDERRRLAEEERLRRLREEEERRRLAGLHAHLARATADTFVKALLENEVSQRMLQARNEYSERALMSVEDDESQAQRAEWDRLNDERLRLLAEARRLEAERRRRVILAMESSITVDIETIVVQEELREMLRVEVEELERQRALDAENARRLLLSNVAREMAERLVNGWLAMGIQNLTETDEMRARRLAEEEGNYTHNLTHL